MNDDQSNMNSGNEPWNTTGMNAEDLSVAAMLRACADEELCSIKCERLKRYLREHPEAEAQIEFEKTLKNSCDRVMGSTSACPDTLRAVIEAMAGDSMTSAGIDSSNRQSRQASFWKRSPMMSAMAAALVLAAGALIYQSASIISKGSGLGIVNSSPVAYAERVGNFVAREHKRCCDDNEAAAKMIHIEIEESIAYFSDRFEHPVTTPIELDNQAQIRYFGGGDCSVPATDKSGHLRFDAVAPDGKISTLSLFVAPNPGLLELKEGVTYMLNSTHQHSEQETNIFAWVTDGVMYLLVSEAKEDMCASVRAMLNAPTELQQL